MSVYSRVMLAMDMSERTEELLSAFYSLCPDPSTDVFLLHVVEDPEEAALGSSYYKKTYSKLQGFQNDLNRAGYDDVRILWVQNNEVLEGIEDSVEEYAINLLIMVSHGKGLFQSTLVGSTTFDVVRATTVPTVIIKGEEQLDDYLARILLPTDFSKKSLMALNVIRSLREHVGEVLFVHVIERCRNIRQLREKTEAAHAMIGELVEELKVFGIPARFIVEQGVASKEICRLARNEKCTMIFAAKTGAGLVKGLLMGSTAQNIAINSECSLFVLPEEGADQS